LAALTTSPKPAASSSLQSLAGYAAAAVHVIWVVGTQELDQCMQAYDMFGNTMQNALSK
jgi:hypothetical protein